VCGAVDESIMETVQQLNMDYLNVDSPAKFGVNRSDLCSEGIAADALPGMPVFDTTPMPSRVDVGDISGLSGVRTEQLLFDNTPILPRVDGGDNKVADGDGSTKGIVSDAATDMPLFDNTPMINPGESTGGPLFDNTPMLSVQNDPLVAIIPPSTECTPVMQDTPSQSVDGPEEVTQMHNGPEQLAKYEAERAVKVAEHQKKVLEFRRRHPNRGKSVNISDPTCKQLQLSPAKKARAAVVKQKAVVVEAPRRSPRFGKIVTATSLPHVPPPAADLKSLKRKLVDDKAQTLGNEDCVDLQSHASEVVFLPFLLFIRFWLWKSI